MDIALRDLPEAFATPKSKKAKNRFANLMDNDDMCFIEQDHGDRLLLTSKNGRNHFWVSLIGDTNWQVEI